MTKSFMMKLDEIQPSQLFINSEKLSLVMKTFDVNPRSIETIPVKKIGEQIVFVDGHTRAFAAFLKGMSEVKVYWEEDELDWDEYEVCVDWCKKEGINTIADLKERVIPSKEYQVLWLDRCEKMQRELEAKRNQK
ncbi:hypothetical protein MUP01_01755 [Candidatus Bathyarchaeota archaeon]|nr:hypothetical protein [Candidatus Bathyarchaeota archaeon]